MTKEKSEIVKFLEQKLLEKLELYYLTESDYRALTSMVMSTSKPRDELLSAQTKTKQSKEGLEVSIRNLRGVIQEIKDGRLDI